MVVEDPPPDEVVDVSLLFGVHAATRTTARTRASTGRIGRRIGETIPSRLAPNRT